MERLSERGITIVDSKTSDEALRLLISSPQPFDAVITHMGRDEGGSFNPDAGRDLIRAIRAAHFDCPVYVYTTSRTAAERGTEVEAAGGNAITASPVTLFELLGATG
jgi:CheY-like chemotaxis protein